MLDLALSWLFAHILLNPTSWLANPGDSWVCMSLYEFVIGSLVGKLSPPVLDLQWINGNFSRPRGNLSIPDCFPPMLPHIFIVTSTKISIEHLVSNNGLVVAFGVGDGLLNSTAAVTHARDDVIHAPVPRSGTNMNRNSTNIWWCQIQWVHLWHPLAMKMGTSKISLSAVRRIWNMTFLSVEFGSVTPARPYVNNVEASKRQTFLTFLPCCLHNYIHLMKNNDLPPAHPNHHMIHRVIWGNRFCTSVWVSTATQQYSQPNCRESIPLKFMKPLYDIWVSNSLDIGDIPKQWCALPKSASVCISGKPRQTQAS